MVIIWDVTSNSVVPKYHTAQSHIPEIHNLTTHHHEDIKSHLFILCILGLFNKSFGSSDYRIQLGWLVNSKLERM
jgi:hypothetical protein